MATTNETATARSDVPTKDATRQARPYVTAVAVIAVAVLLIVWVASNNQRVAVDWLVKETTGSLALIIFVAAATGWALGLLTVLAFRMRAKRASRL